jgi:hypothetical protein
VSRSIDRANFALIADRVRAHNATSGLKQLAVLSMKHGLTISEKGKALGEEALDGQRLGLQPLAVVAHDVVHEAALTLAIGV